MNVMALVIAVAAATSVLMLHVEAAKYTVRDELGWTIPPGGAATYEAWAAKHSLVVDDILTFNFAVGESDLALNQGGL
ncbi:hypothetical protein D8674_014479 [Pyrus ussuriensis x Pyrus communis]|uniref:Phytocyanin domain-containing protein n=1 Tax=Pyrus ussuriensis x Pyrus communis TaxID=2448454 RepID=A0A5N5GZU0_9ROSA|nr:hypothetical protein D8674_014479 [Pyrus ussuriensis x Pyrus communis]